MECDLENIKVNYDICGEGKPILFLHGWGFGYSHRDWLDTVEPFFKDMNGWKRVYIDLPGMGKTPGADWIKSSDDYLDVVIRFIDQSLPDQKIVLAGYSYGAYLAQGVEHKKLEYIEGLCLLAPATRRRPDRNTPEHVVLIENKELLAELPPNVAEGIAGFFVVQNRKIIDSIKESLDKPILGDEDFLNRFPESGNLYFSFDVEKPYQKFSKPTLIVTGRQDSVIGYQDQWLILENYPRATFAVLDRAGHGLMIEQEQLFIALFSEWLDRVKEQME
jgi:pimeloyl-ACP methyl ester carboxylesterase